MLLVSNGLTMKTYDMINVGRIDKFQSVMLCPPFLAVVWILLVTRIQPIQSDSDGKVDIHVDKGNSETEGVICYPSARGPAVSWWND
jgi:hypothetical protein